MSNITQYNSLWEQAAGHTYQPGGNDLGPSEFSREAQDVIPDVNTGNLTSSAIGAGSSIVSSIIEGAASSSQAEKIGKQAYDSAMRQGELVEQQETTDYKNRMEALRQEKKGFELQKRSDTFVTRFNSFVKAIEKAEKVKARQQQLAKNISQKAVNNDNLANIIIQNWGR